MTVRELITKLQALPEADKDLNVEHAGQHDEGNPVFEVIVEEAYFHWWDKDKVCQEPKRVWLS